MAKVIRVLRRFSIALGLREREKRVGSQAASAMSTGPYIQWVDVEVDGMRFQTSKDGVEGFIADARKKGHIANLTQKLEGGE